MSANTKQKLIRFLEGISAVERKIEMLKQVLAEHVDFTPATIFHRLDSERKGYLGIRDIRDFLEQSQIKYTVLQLETLFGRIDENLNGKISLREFQDFILPCQNSKLRYEVMRRQVYIPRPHQKLDNKIQWTLARFFTQIFLEFVVLKKLNSQLKASHDFDPKKLFQLLGGNINQSVNFSGLQNFLKQNKSKLNSQQIGCIIKQLDGSGIGEINFDDFKQYIATLKIAYQHQLFDDMKSFPAVKLKALQEKRNRQQALYKRFLENQLYRDINILRHEPDQQLYSYKIKKSLNKKLLDSTSTSKKQPQRSTSAKTRRI